MRLILDNDPKWTKQHLDFIRNHVDSYGILITDEKYNNELKNIENGTPSSRCNNYGMKCYCIYDNNLYLGDIVINEKDEIDITIFDEYSNNGYATKALKEFITKFELNRPSFEVVIKGENTHSATIKKVLNKVGFTFNMCCPDGTEVWCFYR